MTNLQDVSRTAEALVSAPKPKLDDASAIDAAVGQAITYLTPM